MPYGRSGGCVPDGAAGKGWYPAYRGRIARKGAASSEQRKGAKWSNSLSFHSLRHTAVSLLKDAGIPEGVVMELVGHDSKSMSAHYTHVGVEALEKAVAALPEI
jgi:integrase